MNKAGLLISSLAIAIILALSTLFVVDQRQFGVVYQLGQIQKVITEPGLGWKIPFLQDVKYIDKRLLTLDSADTEPVLTAEKQRIVIDWYVRWRITNPLEYIRNVGLDESAGAQQLNRVVRNAFQEEINRRTVRQLIADERETLMADVKKEVTQAVNNGEKQWGIEIVDVRITRADYVESITESVYRRMQAERERVANELRATGAAEGEQIRADADKQREVTVANAYREAEKLRGQGDAEATKIYGLSFSKDPKFAEFYRSLDAYRESIGKQGDVLVIDPKSSQFFNLMQKGTN